MYYKLSAVDASVGFTKEAWTASLYATNLFNKEVMTNLKGLYSTANGASIQATPIKPRTYGLRLSFDF